MKTFCVAEPSQVMPLIENLVDYQGIAIPLLLGRGDEGELQWKLNPDEDSFIINLVGHFDSYASAEDFVTNRLINELRSYQTFDASLEVEISLIPTPQIVTEFNLGSATEIFSVRIHCWWDLFQPLGR